MFISLNLANIGDDVGHVEMNSLTSPRVAIEDEI
jgi:hypothetical protein